MKALQASRARGNAVVLLSSGAIAVIVVWAFTHSVRRAISFTILFVVVGFYSRHAKSRGRLVLAAGLMAILSIAFYSIGW